MKTSKTKPVTARNLRKGDTVRIGRTLRKLTSVDPICGFDGFAEITYVKFDGWTLVKSPLRTNIGFALFANDPDTVMA